MDHGKGLKNGGTFASEASGPQKLEKLHLGGNLKFFGYGQTIKCSNARLKTTIKNPCICWHPQLFAAKLVKGMVNDRLEGLNI